MASAWKLANLRNLGVPGGYVSATQAGASPTDPLNLGGFTSGTDRNTYLPPEKQQAFATLNQFLQDPLQNITNRLGPLLRSLVPSEQQARQGYLDVGRRAGALRSGAFAQGARQLEGDIFGRRAETATRASLGALGPMITGYGTALTGIPALERSVSRGQQLLPTGAGAGGGAGSDFGGFGFGFSPESQRVQEMIRQQEEDERRRLAAIPGGARYGTDDETDEMSGGGGATPYFDPTAFRGGTAAWDSPSPFDFTGGEQQHNWSAFTPGIYD